MDQVYEELSEKVFFDAKADDGAFEKFLTKLKEVYYTYLSIYLDSYLTLLLDMIVQKR